MWSVHISKNKKWNEQVQDTHEVIEEWQKAKQRLHKPIEAHTPKIECAFCWDCITWFLYSRSIQRYKLTPNGRSAKRKEANASEIEQTKIKKKRQDKNERERNNEV